MDIESPHRRFNPLLQEWVLVSPHRAKRPWQGSTEPIALSEQRYDPECYLCPGNHRAGGASNPAYTSTFVFENDFPALLDVPPQAFDARSELFQAEAVGGTCRVICYAPDHSLTMARMTTSGITNVIQTWKVQYEELIASHEWVQIFENKGEVMGCSSPHPHGQIWASGHVPTDPQKALINQRAYFQRHQSPMLLDYVDQEIAAGDRVVEANDGWVALVPWWAVWPFQIMLLPRFKVTDFSWLDDSAIDQLASLMKSLLVRYDNLFSTSFPYSMGWYAAPAAARADDAWQLHCNFYPPLLRSASVRKFMVGYELLSEAQRDMMPEQAAARLREQSGIEHYLDI